jgi:putative RecB family exonuclease
MPQRYSFSQINGYKNCPRKYKFQYIERAEVEKPVSVELFLGSAVHKSLEQIYKLKMSGIVLKLDQLLKDYHLIWEGPDRDHIKVTREHLGIDDFINSGEEILKKYYETYSPFDQDDSLALERNISFPLDQNGRFTISSKIDRICKRKSDNAIEIIDYKTDKTLPPQQALDNDEQLALYQMGVKHIWPDFENIELKKIFLNHGIEMKTIMDDDKLEEIRIRTFHKILEIEQAKRKDDFPTKETALCDWCVYYELCPAKRHQLAIEGEIIDDFDAKKAVELAEKYLELNRKQKLIKSEMDALKQDIAGYCEREDLTKVKTDHGDVKVSIAEKEELPSKTKDEDAYVQMTILSRDAELDECFKLDQRVLYKDFLMKDRLPDDLAAKLREFLITNKNIRITALPKKD